MAVSVTELSGAINITTKKLNDGQDRVPSWPSDVRLLSLTEY